MCVLQPVSWGKSRTGARRELLDYQAISYLKTKFGQLAESGPTAVATTTKSVTTCVTSKVLAYT